jgi:hypothetical protein
MTAQLLVRRNHCGGVVNFRQDPDASLVEALTCLRDANHSCVAVKECAAQGGLQHLDVFGHRRRRKAQLARRRGETLCFNDGSEASQSNDTRVIQRASWKSARHSPSVILDPAIIFLSFCQ